MANYFYEDLLLTADLDLDLANGDLKIADSHFATRQAILLALGTERGDNLFSTLLSAGLKEFFGRPLNSFTISELKNRVIRSLQNILYPEDIRVDVMQYLNNQLIVTAELTGLFEGTPYTSITVSFSLNPTAHALSNLTFSSES